MRRLLYVYDHKTGQQLAEQDVTEMTEGEIFAVKYKMLCKWDLYGVLVDTKEDGNTADFSLPGEERDRHS